MEIVLKLLQFHRVNFFRRTCLFSLKFNIVYTTHSHVFVQTHTQTRPPTNQLRCIFSLFAVFLTSICTCVNCLRVMEAIYNHNLSIDQMCIVYLTS